MFNLEAISLVVSPEETRASTSFSLNVKGFIWIEVKFLRYQILRSLCKELEDVTHCSEIFFKKNIYVCYSSTFFAGKLSLLFYQIPAFLHKKPNFKRL